MTYHPQQRQVPVEIQPAPVRISGVFHLPLKSGLVDYINHTKDFLPLTRVSFEGSSAPPLQFLAIQRDAAMLIAAKEETNLITASGLDETTPLTVYCLLERGNVSGEVHVLKGVRASDYFAAQRGFVLLRDCDALLTDRWGQSVSEHRWRFVLVNVRAIIGVSDAGTR